MTRTDYTASEARWGIGWILGFAVMSALIQITSIDLAWGIPSVIAAGFFGAVWTKTARLWTSKSVVVLLPTVFWVGSFTLFFFGVEVTRALLAEHCIRAIALLSAGIIGGIWPLARSR